MNFTRGIEFISGQRGTGKTKYLASRVLSAEPRILIYDHMAELAGRAPGYAVTRDLEEAVDLVHVRARGICHVCYQPPAGADAGEFAVLCSIPRSVRDLIIVVDEIDQLAGSVQNQPPAEFKTLVHFGRHFGASIVACARRPADVSRALTSQARRFVLFRQTEPVDVKFLKSVLGRKAEECKDLPDLEYIAFEGGRTFRGRVDPGA